MPDSIVAMETVLCETLLVVVICCLEFSRATNSSYAPTYQVLDGDREVKVTGTNIPETRIVPLDSTRDSVTNFVDIVWLNSTTTSISIRWNISSKYKKKGYLSHSTVEYFPTGGRFTSHPLPSNIREFTFNKLDMNTLYTICVNVIETYGKYNESKTKHSNCLRINTVDYVRQESVAIMLVTIGYYVFMGLLGYTQWRRRLWSIRQRNREKSNGGNSCNNAMRWRDLAEREKLFSEPTCSIEETYNAR